MSLESAWPPFGLRIRSARLELRLPTDDDLAALIAVAKTGIHAADEMPFAVPWSTLPSPAFQGRGLGTEMRAAVLAFAFDTLGAEVARTQAFFDNAQSNTVSRRLGYAPDGIGRLAPHGIARETQRFRMTRDAWRSVPRPPIVVEGFEPCRALFGVEAQ